MAMPNWHALSKEKHINSGWIAPTGYPQAKSDSIVPILAAEIGQALAFYPLAFSKTDASGYQLNALLSLESGTNLFVNMANQWMVPYIPAAFRSYPFNMMSNSSADQVLAVDIDSGFFHEQAQAGDLAVLTSEGEPADSMKPLINFMQQRSAQQVQTNLLVKSLADCDIIEPWSIDVRFGPEEGDVRKLLGLYRINEKALQELPGAELSELAKSGALGLAYAQLLSLGRIKELQARYTQYKLQVQKPDIDKVDLDKMFDEGPEDDLFSF